MNDWRMGASRMIPISALGNERQTAWLKSRYVIQSFYETLPSSPPELFTTDAELVQAHRTSRTRETPSRIIISSPSLVDDIQAITKITLPTSTLL